MLISQSWKETGNRKQEAGENLYSCLLFPASCLLSVITATPKGNKSASHDQKSYLHCDLIDEGEPDVEG